MRRFLLLALTITACSNTANTQGGGTYLDASLTFGDTTSAGSKDTGTDGALLDTAASVDGKSGGTDAEIKPDSAVADTAPTDIDNFFDDVQASDDATDGGSVPGVCNARTQIIYLVTKKKVLLSFDPKTKTIQTIGPLNCPGAQGSPFSMSVDRNADAWVLYTGGGMSLSGGGLYKVSTVDASCQTTAYVPNGQGMELFGMGFTANAPGSQDETLFVTGTTAANLTKVKSTLGTVTTPAGTVAKVGTLDIAGGCDLTGNGKGELFGFFAGTTPPTLRQIDTASGSTIGTPWELPEDMTTGVLSWAFAQWGGEFYLFVKNVLADSSDIWTLDPTTGVSTLLMEGIGHIVTGAGVSACAPTAKP